MKKNKTAPAPEQERMDLPGLGENENEHKEKPENRPLEEPKSYEEAIEAILFAAGHPVSYEALAKTFDLTAPIIRKTVKEYAEKYNHSKVPRGVILLALDDECQLCTKADYLPYIRFALGIRRSDMIRVGSIAVTDDLSDDVRTALFRVPVLFQENNSCSFSHYKAASSLVKGNTALVRIFRKTQRLAVHKACH